MAPSLQSPMSWLLSPSGCRGRITGSLLHPLRRKSPPPAASLAKEQEPELANAANRNCNQKFLRSDTGNKPPTTLNPNPLGASSVQAAPLPSATGAQSQGSGAAPALPLAPPRICAPSRTAATGAIKPGNNPSSACAECDWKSLSLLQHTLLYPSIYSFPWQGKGWFCFF